MNAVIRINNLFGVQIKLSKDLPDELLYGRVGFLWACLFLNKHLGQGTVPSSCTVGLVPTILLMFYSVGS